MRDRFSVPPAVNKGPTCGLGLLLSSLDPDERSALEEALANPLWRHASIEEALRAEDHQIDASTISRHRRGMCKCQPRQE